MIVSSFFIVEGSCVTGLIPTVKIWQVDGVSSVLVVNGASMVEVDNGFYQYTFNQPDDTVGYLVLIDGGNTLPPESRYQTSEISSAAVSSSDIERVANGVWDKPANITDPGSFGHVLNEIHNSSNQLVIDVSNAMKMCELLIKYQSCRTVIDKRSCTLTIYDADQITPLHVFQLRDASGIPSITDIAERAPI